ncbi:hypothetical protein, partial [Bacteroides thetaiotaomicron]|uniref:hypothetical protein n=1 Tax=Bacteroides thetaiotaomicron TaxID=818 RepID=UPI001A92917D
MKSIVSVFFASFICRYLCTAGFGFPVHISINAKSDLVAALRLLFTVEYLFVSLFLHLRFSLSTEMFLISVSRLVISAGLL